jgi:hypothetical protein
VSWNSVSARGLGLRDQEGRRRRPFQHFIDASFGSIYPALTQLAAKAVTVREEEQTANLTRSLRHNRVGKNALAKAISVAPAKDKYSPSFFFRCLRDYMSPDVILAAIQKQLMISMRIWRIAECSQSNACGQVTACADYGNAVLTAGVKCLNIKG